LRLIALGCVLIIAFAVIALRFRPSTGQVIVPTLMSLPSVTPSEEVQIANVSTSTHSQQTSSATSAASSTPSNTATSTATSSTTRTATLPPITPSPTNEVVNVEPPTEPVPNRVIITFTSEVNAEEQAAYIESIGGNITQSIDSLNAVV